MEDCIFSPYSSENFVMKEELASCLGESSEVKQNNLKDILKNENTRGAFLRTHPSPCFQGPFLRPLGQKFLDQSFSDFTSFKHGDTVKCGFWSPEEDSANNYKTKHSRKDIMFKMKLILLVLVQHLMGVFYTVVLLECVKLVVLVICAWTHSLVLNHV